MDLNLRRFRWLVLSKNVSPGRGLIEFMWVGVMLLVANVLVAGIMAIDQDFGTDWFEAFEGAALIVFVLVFVIFALLKFSLMPALVIAIGHLIFLFGAYIADPPGQIIDMAVGVWTVLRTFSIGPRY